MAGCIGSGAAVRVALGAQQEPVGPGTSVAGRAGRAGRDGRAPYRQKLRTGASRATGCRGHLPGQPQDSSLCLGARSASTSICTCSRCNIPMRSGASLPALYLRLQTCSIASRPVSAQRWRWPRPQHSLGSGARGRRAARAHHQDAPALRDAGRGRGNGEALVGSGL